MAGETSGALSSSVATGVLVAEKVVANSTNSNKGPGFTQRLTAKAKSSLSNLPGVKKIRSMYPSLAGKVVNGEQNSELTDAALQTSIRQASKDTTEGRDALVQKEDERERAIFADGAESPQQEQTAALIDAAEAGVDGPPGEAGSVLETIASSTSPSAEDAEASAGDSSDSSSEQPTSTPDNLSPKPPTPDSPTPKKNLEDMVNSAADAQKAEREAQELKEKEEKLDKALKRDATIDSMFAEGNTDSQQQRAALLKGIAEGQMDDVGLEEAVHQGRRHPEIAKALDERAEKEGKDSEFAKRFQTARGAEAKARAEALKKVGVEINSARGTLQIDEKSAYYNLNNELTKIDPAAPGADVDRRNVWIDALNSTDDIAKCVMVKTLALYHTQDQDMSFAQAAFDVVRADMKEDAEVAAITEDNIEQEIDDVLNDKDTEMLSAEMGRKFKIKKGKEFKLDKPTRKDAFEAVGVFSKVKEIRKLTGEAIDLAKARNRYTRARAIEIANGNTAEDINKQIESVKTRELRTQEDVVRANIELQCLEKAKNLVDKGIIKKGDLDPRLKELQAKIDERRTAMNNSQNEFNAIMRRIEGKIPPDNKYLNYLRNLPDLIQEYPDAGRILEKINKHGVDKKKLILLLVLLTLGALPIWDEMTKLMRVQG